MLLRKQETGQDESLRIPQGTASRAPPTGSSDDLL
jgi:hypothetical protein